ncbi:cation:proton antiporter [Trinickia sp. EG282A]|uniref:cation:proton antiporter domain-containing protein n=1 Tax=Trinickia sp. EG282A TaxID=3237013 RepID=UPI0034D34ADE
MHEAIWFLVVGGMCVAMGVASSFVKRLPLTGAMLYMAAGFALGPAGAGMLSLDIVRDAHLVRVLSEIALLASLFAIGLRLRLPLSDRLWTLPLRLGLLGMAITIPMIVIAGVWVLGLPWPLALLLAAMLSPTDPVLAHDVQVHDANDLDTVRFALSGEGGLNDGIAQPFTIIALMLCAGSLAHPSGGQVLALAGETLWGLLGGIAIGGIFGFATTHAVTWLRTKHSQALGLEGFFALGLIELSYGAAQLAHAFGFLAAFAAGVAMRRVEHRATGERTPQAAIGSIDPADVAATAAHPESAHAYMAETVLRFTVEVERLVEMAMMIVVGSLLATLNGSLLTWRNVALFLVLFLVVRPVTVELSLLGSHASRKERGLMSWFGIRGVGTVYYLADALEKNQSSDVKALAPIALAIVTASVLVHGVSATPLMRRYRRYRMHKEEVKRD